uniref:Methylmalonyl-CoA epimerase, mitochondrial n=1 Tax=Gopherus agassizii TaxID=38772 RepID=A0A452I1H1_9SAUR
MGRGREAGPQPHQGSGEQVRQPAPATNAGTGRNVPLRKGSASGSLLVTSRAAVCATGWGTLPEGEGIVRPGHSFTPANSWPHGSSFQNSFQMITESLWVPLETALPPAPRLLNRLKTTASTVRTSSMSRTLTQKVPCSLWKLGRLSHVAIAVPNLEKAQSFYKSVLGAQVSGTVPLPEHGVYTVFVELGNTKLELLHPLGEKSPIAGFLQKNKAGGMHHICIEVDDLKAAMTELKEKKIQILSEEPKIGAHGKPVIFLHPKDCDGVLVELEQA